MIGFIGGGNMAEAMIKGMTASGMRDILVSEPKEERRAELERRYGIRTTGANAEVAASCRFIVLAVKPQVFDAVLAETAGSIPEETTVVSIAAGITLSYLQSRLRTRKIVRVMPNTPALVQEGMSVMSLCECFSGPEINTVREILMSVGRVKSLPEGSMNAVTALSGSGPAFIALFVEGMIGGGEAMGLTRSDATELAVQTLLGTARMLDAGMEPGTLRQMVTSPGGTTEAGLAVFGRRGLTEIVREALEAARDRAGELGRRYHGGD